MGARARAKILVRRCLARCAFGRVAHIRELRTGAHVLAVAVAVAAAAAAATAVRLDGGQGARQGAHRRALVARSRRRRTTTFALARPRHPRPRRLRGRRRASRSPPECTQIIDATEKSDGFSFWDPEGADAKKRSHRNADTCEFSGAQLCASLWPRLQPFVAARWSLAADASEARCHEPELEGGEWVATGLNEHLLVNRYGAGGHFAPHADGSTVVDFNRRSLFTVLVYLNDVAEGGATQLLSEEERECAIVHDPLSAPPSRAPRPSSTPSRRAPAARWCTGTRRCTPARRWAPAAPSTACAPT